MKKSLIIVPTSKILSLDLQMFKQNSQLLWGKIQGFNDKYYQNAMEVLLSTQDIQSWRDCLYRSKRKNHPQPSISNYTSLDRTNSSNENVFLACPRWKHLKLESLCYSFYCDCTTVLANSNIKILFSVPQLSYRMNKFSLLHFQPS